MNTVFSLSYCSFFLILKPLEVDHGMFMASSHKHKLPATVVVLCNKVVKDSYSARAPITKGASAALHFLSCFFLNSIFCCITTATKSTYFQP